MLAMETLKETWRGFLRYRDRAHRNRLIEAYLPLVKHAAGRLKDKLPASVDVLDLISAGRIGLIKAVESFEASHGVKFETYCNQRVRGAILDDLRETDWVPRLVRARANLLRRARAALSFELGREPTEPETARRMGLPRRRYYALLDEVRVRYQVSIEGDLARVLGHEDSTGEELLPDPRAEPPLERLAREEIREVALKGLSPKERAIVDMHYFEGRSMKQIGASLGISSSRVCQLHTRVMRLLRERFLSEAYRDWYDDLCCGRTPPKIRRRICPCSPPSSDLGTGARRERAFAPAACGLRPCVAGPGL